ncbi:MAG: hypothetical protein ABSB74_14400 [Tepidisphaeraceae bacterium]
MISKRRAVQLGVLSAIAVFAACIGVLVFQGGDSDAAQNAKIQTVGTPAAGPDSLSSTATPVVHLQTAHN